MITTAQMYWLTRLDSIKCFLGHSVTPLCILCAIAFGILAVVFFSLGTFTGNGYIDFFSGKSDEYMKDAQKRLRHNGFRFAITFFALATVATLCTAANALTPSTREMAAIIIVPKIANSEKVQTAGNKLYELALEWMEALMPSNGREVTK